MAKSHNLLTSGFRGGFNKQMVFRQVGGQTIISAYPYFDRRVFSKKQLANQSKMRDANEAVQAILADPAQRNAAQVRLDVTQNKLYTALIKEYFQNIRAKEEK